eukprot:716409-Prymnesium_polylepis.1
MCVTLVRSVHGTRQQQHGAAVPRAAGRPLLLRGWCTPCPCESRLCWACVTFGNSSIGRQC